MLISIATESGKYPCFFKEAEVSTIGLLSRHITTSIWSPIIWETGRRLTENFRACDFLALDFDDGKWTIEHAKNFIAAQGCAFVIGLTKSHGLAKGDMPACDRFRLIMPWTHTIGCVDTYRQNMTRIMGDIPCDRACKDGARIYQPCKSIESFSIGKRVPWLPYQQPVYSGYAQAYRDAGILPSWLRAMLAESPGPGRRNNHAFKIAVSLASHGYSEAACIEALLAAPIELSQREKEHVGRSGFRAAQRGRSHRHHESQGQEEKNGTGGHGQD